MVVIIGIILVLVLVRKLFIVINVRHICQGAIRIPFSVEIVNNITIVEDNNATFTRLISSLDAAAVYPSRLSRRVCCDFLPRKIVSLTSEDIGQIPGPSSIKYPYFDPSKRLCILFILESQYSGQINKSSYAETYHDASGSSLSRLHRPHQILTSLG